MGKKPEDFKQHINNMEESMIYTVGSLVLLTEEEWRKDLKFPIGLVKTIQKSLASGSGEPNARSPWLGEAYGDDAKSPLLGEAYGEPVMMRYEEANEEDFINAGVVYKE